ncbi:MAG: LytTR family DNA-binding domain-containing protein [Thermotaleaceae bacterium]
MLKVVIGEDNPYERLMLKKMINRIPDLVLGGETDNGADLIELVDRIKPQIVFLDINMPHRNGLEAAVEILDINPQTFIIFATAYDHYTKEAFDVYAFDYLVKPYNFERIVKTINRIKGFVYHPFKEGQHAEYPAEYDNIQLNNKHRHMIIQSNDRLLFIKINEIILITRNNRKTEIHTLGGIYKINDPLEKIESKLDENFFRCHKGYIINVEKIVELLPWGNKTYVIHLENTQETALITTEKLKLFRQKYCVL